MREWLVRFRWLQRSSTLRLAALLSGIFAIGFVVAIFVALTLGQRANERRLDATLEILAQGNSAAEIDRGTAALILRPLDDLSGLPDPFRRAALRGGGTVFLRDDLMRSDVWRVLVAQDNTGLPIMVGIPIDDSEDAQELLAQILWTTAAIVIALTLAIGVWAGLLAQRRLAQINTTLDRLASGDLSARSGHSKSKDDLDDMSQNLDQTAAELERLVSQTRHLSASIAHDLRTPLARLRAQLEMLPASDGRGAALEEASHLSDVFDTIMRVARIEAGQGRDGFEPLVMDDFVREMAEIYGPVVEDEGKILAVDVVSPATVQADRGMLVQAMANLIQNALVHGGDRIILFVDGPKMGVADNGAGVDPAQFAEIIKPMVRLDAARSTQGSGLGLALVRAVADRHGARLDLAENTPQGLRIAINFTEL
ncbi:HAMP domain-containing histidine kinase [Octadecabacter sp. G9-8]|uniref:histidine kinase n=1 Tax=Octadecabacter dasysiphoniae TaxID=2909341 RepID=A0ABS9CTE1_9RHOB|nr:HAMP domain-containing histidine kinase [Octadecabacter dasysiphoniae]